MFTTTRPTGQGTVSPCTSWIGDEWLPERGSGYERQNPADRDDVLGPYCAAEPADVDHALEAARRAQPECARRPAPLRGEVLLRAVGVVRERADAIVAGLTREEGKALAEARAEVLGGAQILEFLGGGGLWGGVGRVVESLRPTTLLYTRRQPLGVVAAITPWNFPFSNPCIKLGSALVAGNAVVWKPASWTSATALALTTCLVDAGVPPGVLNTLLGSGAQVGDQLARDPRVRAISFTGSTEVGRGLAPQLAKRGARAQLEMGGKNAIVVLEDADLGAAARATARAAFLSAGQKCTAAARVIVLPGSGQAFVEALVAETQALRVGHPTHPETDVGPVVHERQLETHLAAVAAACQDGARLIEGGRRLDGELAKGHYMAPTILERVSPRAAIAQEEIFGPVLVVLDAPGYRAALRITNDTRYGLTAAIYTRDLARALDFAERGELGVVKVNEPPPGRDPHVPTGGWKDSGSGGRELGPGSLDFFKLDDAAHRGGWTAREGLELRAGVEGPHVVDLLLLPDVRRKYLSRGVRSKVMAVSHQPDAPKSIIPLFEECIGLLLRNRRIDFESPAHRDRVSLVAPPWMLSCPCRPPSRPSAGEDRESRYARGPSTNRFRLSKISAMPLSSFRRIISAFISAPSGPNFIL